jgi:hypothetical protein
MHDTWKHHLCVVIFVKGEIADTMLLDNIMCAEI